MLFLMLVNIHTAKINQSACKKQSIFIFFRKYLYSNFIMIDNEVFIENIKMTKVTEKAKLLGLHMEKFCWLEDF